MGKLIAAERQNEILNLLNQQGSVKIAQLSELFQVSKETIRKDLLYLNEAGVLKKSHGGAVAVTDPGNIIKTTSMENRIDINTDIKTKLCQKALEFIPDHGVIFLDSGSTIHCLSQLLYQTSGYTIITPSLNAAYSLSGSQNTILLTGGQLNSITMSTEGLQTTNFISSLKADIAFLGTNGFDQHNGPASSELSDTQIKQSIIANSKVNIVIADSSKATYTSLSQYASWKDIDYFISDQDLPEESVQLISSMTNLIQI